MSVTGSHARTPFQRRLSALDSLFVYAESTLRPLNINFLLTFDDRIRFEDLVRTIGERIHLLPGFRQRLLEVPFEIAYPTLEDDPEFRLENHLYRIRLPLGADRAQAMSLALGEYQMMLDRSRPLWRITLIEDWPDQRSAIALTIHHCLCDGVGAVKILGTLLDTDSAISSCEAAQPGWNPPPIPDSYQMIMNATNELWIKQAGVLTNLAMELTRTPAVFTEQNQLALQGIGEFLGSSQRPIVSVPWNAKPESSVRCYEDFSVDVSDVEALRRSVGGTINDIALCVLTEGAARYMKHHHLLTNGWFRVSCAVNTRGDDSSQGNRLSSMFPEIPATPMDLVERLEAVCDETRRIKRLALPQALERVWLPAEFNPAAAITWAGSGGMRFDQESSNLKINSLGLASDVRSMVSFVFTNVRGSRARQYLSGRQCLEQICLAPIGPNCGYAVAIFSYDQRLFFALTADSMQLPDLDFMKECVQAALDDLRIRAPQKTP
jgi:diacylglycerol O-acyltransferase / wax synthase